jgi:hypothetical protein
MVASDKKNCNSAESILLKLNLLPLLLYYNFRPLYVLRYI